VWAAEHSETGEPANGGSTCEQATDGGSSSPRTGRRFGVAVSELDHQQPTNGDSSFRAEEDIKQRELWKNPTRSAMISLWVVF
jgi:hypothetical protein